MALTLSYSQVVACGAKPGIQGRLHSASLTEEDISGLYKLITQETSFDLYSWLCKTHPRTVPKSEYKIMCQQGLVNHICLYEAGMPISNYVDEISLTTPVCKSASAKNVVRYAMWFIRMGRMRVAVDSVVVQFVERLFFDQAEPKEIRMIALRNTLITVSTRRDIDLVTPLLNLREKELMDEMGAAGMFNNRVMTEMACLGHDYLPYIWNIARVKRPQEDSLESTARSILEVISIMSSAQQLLTVIPDLHGAWALHGISTLGALLHVTCDADHAEGYDYRSTELLMFVIHQIKPEDYPELIRLVLFFGERMLIDPFLKFILCVGDYKTFVSSIINEFPSQIQLSHWDSSLLYQYLTLADLLPELIDLFRYDFVSLFKDNDTFLILARSLLKKALLSDAKTFSDMCLARCVSTNIRLPLIIDILKEFSHLAGPCTVAALYEATPYLWVYLSCISSMRDQMVEYGRLHLEQYLRLIIRSFCYEPEELTPYLLAFDICKEISMTPALELAMGERRYSAGRLDMMSFSSLWLWQRPQSPNCHTCKSQLQDVLYNVSADRFGTYYCTPTCAGQIATVVTCMVCGHDKDLVVNLCLHVCCKECKVEIMNYQACCPMCRASMTNLSASRLVKAPEVLAAFQAELASH